MKLYIKYTRPQPVLFEHQFDASRSVENEFWYDNSDQRRDQMNQQKNDGENEQFGFLRYSLHVIPLAIHLFHTTRISL